MSDVDREFWKQVGTEAKVEEVEVGEAVYVERHFVNGGRELYVAIVTDKWQQMIDGVEQTQVKFRRARTGDVYERPTLTIVAEGRST